jgi:acylpyruvate hydrolase
MRLLSFEISDRRSLALESDGAWLDLGFRNPQMPDDVASLLKSDDWRARVTAAAIGAPEIDLDRIAFLPPIRNGEKILCVGLNYLAHVGESPYQVPDYPIFFPRFASGLIGHRAPMIRPPESDQLDFEVELAVIIGKTGRRISAEDALDHVAGYTILNEGSIRDYQFKSPQWTMGKNFDGTAGCGPWFVTADELPAGGKGLKIETRVNGLVEQSATTSDMMFDVATLISLASAVLTLRPGDMIATGTPAGVRFGRKPPVYLQPGDLCSLSIEGIGTLENIVQDER